MHILIPMCALEQSGKAWQVSMVKIIVDKIDGHIVYLRYFEEMKDDRMETLVFDLDSYKTLEHSIGIDVSTFYSRHAKQKVYTTWEETGEIPKVLVAAWM